MNSLLLLFEVVIVEVRVFEIVGWCRAGRPTAFALDTLKLLYLRLVLTVLVGQIPVTHEPAANERKIDLAGQEAKHDHSNSSD